MTIRQQDRAAAGLPLGFTVQASEHESPDPRPDRTVLEAFERARHAEAMLALERRRTGRILWVASGAIVGALIVAAAGWVTWLMSVTRQAR